MIKSLTLAAVAAFAMSGAVSASTAVPSFTSTPGGFDAIFVESNGFRGGATGDIVDLDIGTIDPLNKVGLGGRIVSQSDVWNFSTVTAFTLSLTDLGIDTNSGFDSTSLLGGVNGSKSAEFTLVNNLTSSVVSSIILTSLTAPPAFSFADGPGSYSLIIDGSVDVQTFGSTYDIAIETAAIPVPAALPLLAAALGMLGLMRRRAAV